MTPVSEQLMLLARSIAEARRDAGEDGIALTPFSAGLFQEALGLAAVRVKAMETRLAAETLPRDPADIAAIYGANVVPFPAGGAKRGAA